MNDKKTVGASAAKADCGKQNGISTMKMAVTPAVEAAKGKNSKDEKSQAHVPMPIIMVPVSELDPHPLVKDFYPIEPDMLASITELMQERGYDPRFPIQVCMKDGKYLVWDGITRLRAATEADIETVPTIVSEFATDDDLMEAVVEVQLRRRHATDGVVITSVEKLIGIAASRAKANQGRRSDLLGTTGPIGPKVESCRANEYIARMIGKSATTVKRIKEVIENPELKRRVLAGELSLNQAYESIHPRKPAEKYSQPAAVENSVDEKLEAANAEVQALYRSEEEDEPVQESEPDADSKADTPPPALPIPEGMITQRPAASAARSGVAEKVVTGSDEEFDTIRVPIKFLQVAAVHIHSGYTKELIEIVGGPASAGGKIIVEAIEKQRSIERRGC